MAFSKEFFGGASGAGRDTKECRVMYASSRVNHARAVDIKIKQRYIIETFLPIFICSSMCIFEASLFF